MLEKTLESPLDCKEIQPVHSKGDQPWDFFGRNDAQVETPVLWPPHAKSWLIGKDSDAGRDWGQEEKGTTEDEMAGWHHWLDGRESQWTPGVGDGFCHQIRSDLLVVQGTLKSLLQHHSSKASILRCSAFFTVQLSHPYPISWSFPGNLYFLLWWYCSVQWVSCVLVEKLNRVLLCKRQIKTRLSWV